ncbi:MAG: flagella basal body P-ring formation protein FlgA [Desulfobacteraceae bacterium 4572_35.1]|nr:MAG: flagella basal body P-ring formation protein FlgA [Desulfobacteraceae bacterium 4572_35.1]
MVRMLLLISFILLSCGSTYALQIDVRSSAVVSKTQVVIGDVVDITPPSPRLSAKRLLRAPLPGKSITVKRDQIRRVLQQFGLTEKNCEFSGADEVVVKRDSQTITFARVQRDIADYLARAQRQLSGAKFKFIPQGNVKDIVVPAGRLQVKVIPALAQIVGSRRFTLIYTVDGRTVKNMSVSGKLQLLASVVVAQRNLRRGAIVGSQDVKMVVVDISKTEQPLYNLIDVVGMMVARSIRSAQIVDGKNLVLPPLIKRGAFVKLIARRGAMLLTATGIAMQEGKMEDIIRVRNSASQKEVLARVIGPDKVEVGF